MQSKKAKIIVAIAASVMAVVIIASLVIRFQLLPRGGKPVEPRDLRREFRTGGDKRTIL